MSQRETNRVSLKICFKDSKQTAFGQFQLNRSIDMSFIIKSSLAINTMPVVTLLQQMQQVQALQLRTQKYHSLFVNSFHPQQERNQFLSSSEEAADQEILFSSTKGKDFCRQAKKTEKQICESQIITARDDVNISQIFEDIVLLDNPAKKKKQIEVQLIFQNARTVNLDIEQFRGNDFSLSNFSSFNANRDEDNILEFRQLLVSIQRQCGRTLSKAGVDRIIEEISKQVKENNLTIQLGFFSKQGKTEVNSSPGTGRDNSRLFDSSQINHKYDTALNNRVFNRNRTERLESIQISKKSEASVNRSVIVQKDRSVQKGKRSKQKIMDKEPALKQQKQNGYKSRQTQLHSKEIRVIRKNNAKPLLLVYSDIRQVDQFCITNKIFGKQREKIVKAVQLNKTCLNLD